MTDQSKLSIKINESDLKMETHYNNNIVFVIIAAAAVALFVRTTKILQNLAMNSRGAFFWPPPTQHTPSTIKIVYILRDHVYFIMCIPLYMCVVYTYRRVCVCVFCWVIYR